MISAKAIKNERLDNMPANFMINGEEKRKYARTSYSVPIEISYLGSGDRLDGQSLNHCENGMCFESISSFQPGQSLNLRVKKFYSKSQCFQYSKGLRTIALAEVKWCHEVFDTSKFKVGVQFYPLCY